MENDPPQRIAPQEPDVHKVIVRLASGPSPLAFNTAERCRALEKWVAILGVVKKHGALKFQRLDLDCGRP